MVHDSDITCERTVGNVYDALGLPDADELAEKSSQIVAIREHLVRQGLSDERARELLGATAEEVAALRDGPITRLSSHRVSEIHGRLPAVD